MSQVSSPLVTFYDSYFVSAPIKKGKCEFKLPASVGVVGDARLALRRLKIVDFKLDDVDVKDGTGTWFEMSDQRNFQSSGIQEMIFKRFMQLEYFSSGERICYCVSLTIFNLNQNESENLITCELLCLTNEFFSATDNSFAVKRMNEYVSHFTGIKNYFDGVDLSDTLTWPDPMKLVGKFYVGLGFFGTRLISRSRPVGDLFEFAFGAMNDNKIEKNNTISRATLIKSGGVDQPSVQNNIGVDERKTYSFMNSVMICNYSGVVFPEMVYDPPDGVTFFGCIANFFLYLKNILHAKDDVYLKLQNAAVSWRTVLYNSVFLINDQISLKNRVFEKALLHSQTKFIKSNNFREWYKVSSPNLTNAGVCRNYKVSYEPLLYEGPSEYETSLPFVNNGYIIRVDGDDTMVLEFQRLEVLEGIDFYVDKIDGFFTAEFRVLEGFDPTLSGNFI